MDTFKCTVPYSPNINLHLLQHVAVHYVPMTIGSGCCCTFFILTDGFWYDISSEDRENMESLGDTFTSVIVEHCTYVPIRIGMNGNIHIEMPGNLLLCLENLENSCYPQFLYNIYDHE